MPPWCLLVLSWPPGASLVLSCLPGACLVPPWCLPGASLVPQAVQLVLSCLPGVSQAVQGVLSCLPGASQAVQMVLSCGLDLKPWPWQITGVPPVLPSHREARKAQTGKKHKGCGDQQHRRGTHFEALVQAKTKAIQFPSAEGILAHLAGQASGSGSQAVSEL